MNNSLTFPSLLAVLALCACVQPRPVRINSDPNQERMERTQDRIEQDNLEAFIAAHPELDDETIKQLRDGTLSRDEALNQKKPTEKPQ